MPVLGAEGAYGVREMNIACRDAAFNSESGRLIQTLDLTGFEINMSRIVPFKSFCGKGDSLALAADLIVLVVADDQIWMEADIFMDVSGEDIVGREVPPADLPKFGRCCTGCRCLRRGCGQ